MFALMAGAQKCAASVDRQRADLQPVPGADESIDAGGKKRLTNQPTPKRIRREPCIQARGPVAGAGTMAVAKFVKAEPRNNKQTK
jgi:hypothetical protein